METQPTHASLFFHQKHQDGDVMGVSLLFLFATSNLKITPDCFHVWLEEGWCELVKSWC